MALVTVNTTDEGRALRRLDTVSIVNQTANTTTVRQAVSVPLWASSCSWYITVNSMGGSTPLLDFTFSYGDYSTSPPTTFTTFPGIGNAGLTITQITAAAAGGSLITVDMGPAAALDTTGSATASCYYSVPLYLPPYIVYAYTTDGTTDDEDYDFSISVLFRP